MFDTKSELLHISIYARLASLCIMNDTLSAVQYGVHISIIIIHYYLSLLCEPISMCGPSTFTKDIFLSSVYVGTYRIPLGAKSCARRKPK